MLRVLKDLYHDCHQPASCCWMVPFLSIRVCIPDASFSLTRVSSRRQHIRRHLAVLRFVFLQGGIGTSFGFNTNTPTLLDRVGLSNWINHILHSKCTARHQTLRVSWSFFFTLPADGVLRLVRVEFDTRYIETIPPSYSFGVF